jgi:CHRD domain
MRRLGIRLLLSATLIPVFGDAGSAQQVRSEPLRGGNENPPVISDGSGNFRVQIQNGQFRLRYDVAAEENDITQAHLHIGNPGTNGGIVVYLCSNLGNTPAGATVRECPASPGDVTGEILETDVLAVDDIIEAGDLEGLERLARQGAVYANVHTDDHPAGEVRGQLSPRRR